MLDLDLIRIDGGTQARVELNQSVVDEYADGFLAGAQFPPVIVYFDGTDRWLADGFHRFFGAKKAGLTQIYENVVPGTRRDAILHSVKANATHGLKRTSADKRKALNTLLDDAEWAAWPDAELARQCSVSRDLVRAVKEERSHAEKHVTLVPPPETPAHVRERFEEIQQSGGVPRIYTTKHGTTAVMQTSNIGNAAKHRGKPKKVPAVKLVNAEIKAAQATQAKTEAEDRQHMLEQENAALREQLTSAQEDANTLAAVVGAEDRLAAAVAEASKYRKLAQGLQARLDSMLTEISELTKSLKFWKNKAEKGGA
ncbi:hypothetical protein [Pseudorhodoferax sp. Leaf274]|uniref:hypothetical protein n=1 Tax=Pseudorhodoferax sp. Leaf274 TaxID=1736318 RepID=UPI000702E0DC|nr:hypothetical protein [Pseudorhodoferax sp. Leaf274]KQP43933.1 hypothetical protein ASF44_28815 [Pseudorhodoferax sp. Leaf274]